MSNEITLKTWKNLESPSDHILSTLSVYRYLASLQEEGLLSGDWGNYSKTN